MNLIGNIEISVNTLNIKVLEDHFRDTKNIFILSNGNKNDIEHLMNSIDDGDNKPNLYAFLVDEFNNGNWIIKYIGQRKSNKIKERLKQHLIKCPENTNSKLEQIQEEFNKRKRIGIILFSVKPNELRQFYEQKLIAIFKPKWNIQN